MISINSWLWQPRMAHVMTNLGGTGMQIRCLVQTKSLDFFCLTGWYSKSHPLGLIPALTLEHPDHTRWRTHRWMFHQWFMYKGTTNIALQGRTNGFHTYLSCDSIFSVCTATQVVTWHPLLPGLRPKDAHGTDKGYVKEQSDAQAHVVAIPSEVSLKKPSNPLSANLFMKVWRPFGVLFQTWMCLENPIADLILYYWFLHLFTQSVESRSFWVNHLSIGSLRIRWLPKSPCNPRHSMCPLFRSFGINWPEPLLRPQLAAPNVRHPNVNGVG